MYQARHSVWCAAIQYLGCLQREKRLFTCRHAHRSLTTLAHPASTLAALIKTTLCMARRKECQKHVYLLMCSSRSKTGHSCQIYYFRFTCHAHIVNRISQPVLIGSAVTDPKNMLLASKCASWHTNRWLAGWQQTSWHDFRKYAASWYMSAKTAIGWLSAVLNTIVWSAHQLAGTPIGRNIGHVRNRNIKLLIYKVINKALNELY